MKSSSTVGGGGPRGPKAAWWRGFSATPAAVSLLATLTLLATSAAQAAQPPAARPAPDCALALAGQTAATSIHQLRGKVVYVDFWASWCAPCLLSFPFMAALDRDFRGQGLEVVAIDMDRTRKDADRFLERRPATFPIALGRNEDCARKFGVAVMPSSYLIDRNGVIRLVHSGFRNGDEDGLRTAVRQALAGGQNH